MIMRLSRAVVARPSKPFVPSRAPELTSIAKQIPNATASNGRYYLFPSIYRSFFASYRASFGSYQKNLTNLMPFQMALNEIKRRLFFEAPGSARLLFGLLGYSLIPDSSTFNKTIDQIGQLLKTTSNVDQFNEENQLYNRASLDDYELGRMLGYGCNAAVYEARLRQSSQSHGELLCQSNSISSIDADSESDIEILSRESSNSSEFDDENHLNELTLREVRHRASINMRQQSPDVKSDILPDGQFNLAIKMLFNFGVQSNAEALEKAMEKELLPLRHCSSHPNVIRMHSFFVDAVPLLKEAERYYPAAIPTHLSPDGFGRNKTLFIVMRRYDLTLPEYLRSHQANEHERLILFTQLIEALLYLKRHSIVHRDLKSDNLLVSSSTGELVVADFGCALHQPPNLRLPYVTDEIGKGGNVALMAPEIDSCRPGPKSYLDYNKADLWASGTLFYEFFSQPNPFFHGTFRQDTYDDQQLPALTPFTSPIIEQLVFAILRRNPKERPSVSLVSNCLHLYLWFKSNVFEMTRNELYQNYMWTALETFLSKNRLSTVELNLKKFFFQRQCSRSLYEAQSFLDRLAQQI